MKRALSFMLAVIMVLSLVPVVSAAETELINSNGLTVTHSETKLVENGELVEQSDLWGSVTWQAEGDQITAVAISEGDWVGATLTFKNNLDIPATLRFQYTFDRDLVEGEEEYQAAVWGLDGDSGSFEKELEAGESYTITVISPEYNFSGDPEATLQLKGISLSAGGEVTATFLPAENGSYTLEGAAVTGKTPKTAPVGTTYAVAATAASGYRFFGWYNGTRYLSYKAEDKLTINENTTVYPVFIKDNVAVFGVGDARFQSLTEADAAATQSNIYKTIVLMNDGILTGKHTISAGNTLLIPYDAANTVHTEAVSVAVQTGAGWENKAWEEPETYRLLTMAQGAELTVQGSLNVGGRHSAGPFLTAGSPSGDLGMIQMAEGAKITVADGGVIYCWGYIYGDGTVTVKDGGTVHENFQFSDFRGGDVTLHLAESFLVFPLSQYYVQNVEVATTFERGATEYVWGSIYLVGKVLGTSVKFIGDDNVSMFVPGENGSVTKTYDPETDRLIIDVNGDGSINPMGLQLDSTVINTATFVLPINSNMTININSGVTSLHQSLALLPGVELTVAKDATLSVKSREPLKDENGLYVHYTGANNLIVYDRDQWLRAYKPILNETGMLAGAEAVDAYFVYTNAGVKRLQPVAWTPTRSCTRTEADLVDAKVDINGQLITEGYIYTTVDVDLQKYFYEQQLLITGGGAAVTSSQGTGKLVMNNGAGHDAITLQPIQNGTKFEFAYIPMASARLLNKDGSYLDTYTAAPGAKYSYCDKCGHWYAGEKDTHTVDINWVVDGKDGILEVCKGTKPVYNEGVDPVKEGHKFIGWSTGNDNDPEYTSENLPLATEDAVYYACFEKTAGGLKGDVNCDGKIDTYDVTALARHTGGIEELKNATGLANSDVNGDGVVNTYDLTKLARYAGGIDTEL